MKEEEENSYELAQFPLYSPTLQKENRAKKTTEKKRGSKGEKERRKINRAKNTVRRAWLNIREGQMCLQTEAMI